MKAEKRSDGSILVSGSDRTGNKDMTINYNEKCSCCDKPRGCCYWCPFYLAQQKDVSVRDLRLEKEHLKQELEKKELEREIERLKKRLQQLNCG